MRALAVALGVIALVAMGAAWWQTCEVADLRARCANG